MTAVARFASWPRWKRVVALAMPWLVLLVLGEITGRVLERYAGYMPRRAAGYLQGNPYLRTALVPGMRFQSGPFHIDVNSLGFRGPEIAVPKPAGTFRIFAVGESSTFGWKGTYSHEGAWPALLQAKLRAAHPDRHIEIVNAGVPGYTSIEQRLNFLLRISHLQPDALLIYHGNNDLNWSWVPDVETKLIYGRGGTVGQPTWLDRLIEHSYVWMEVRSRLNLFHRASVAKHDGVDPAAMRVLRENLKGLIEDARRAGVRVAIGTFAHAIDESAPQDQFSAEERKLGVPALGRWFDYLSPQGVRHAFPVYNAMIRDLARELDLPLVEPARMVPPTSEYFTDWCHFTAKGEALMAQIWLDGLERTDWFGPPVFSAADESNGR